MKIRIACDWWDKNAEPLQSREDAYIRRVGQVRSIWPKKDGYKPYVSGQKIFMFSKEYEVDRCEKLQNGYYSVEILADYLDCDHGKVLHPFTWEGDLIGMYATSKGIRMRFVVYNPVFGVNCIIPQSKI